MDIGLEFFDQSVQQLFMDWPVHIQACVVRIWEHLAIFGESVGLPYVRRFDDNLLEIRAGENGMAFATVLCTTLPDRLLILSGFENASSLTPIRELRKARERLSKVRDEQV